MRKRYLFKFIISWIIISLITMLIPSINSADFTVSKSSVTLTEGETQIITINALTSTGRIDISSSNAKVASVDTNSIWVENNSKTIVITAQSEGSCSITISGELYDSTTEQEGMYSKTINVKVNKKAEPTKVETNTTPQQNTKPSQNTGTTTKPNTNTVTSNKPSNNGTTTSKPSKNNNVSNQNTVSNNAVATPVETNPEPIVEEPQEQISEQSTETPTNNVLETENIEENKEIENIKQLDTKNITTNKMFIICSVVVSAFICIILSIILVKKVWRK